MPGHDVHVEHDVNGVGQFKAVFGERRADDGHGVRDDVHGAALIGAVGQSIHLFVHFLGLYPVVRGACVLFLFTADERAVLHARHVVGVGAVQVASRELVRVELDEDALLDGLLTQRVELFLFPRDPDNLVRLGDGRSFRRSTTKRPCCSSNSSFVLSLVACSRCNEKEKFCTASCVVCCAALGRQGANRCTGKMAAIEFDSFLPKIVAECLINSNHMVYQFFE